MIDLTPLDVRKKKGDFRRTVRGYDPELVDDFLDMVAERLEELVKQNVALTERAEHLQEQVASYRQREKALNDALVTAQQLRSEAQAQADREAEMIRRDAERQAERIVEEGERSLRDLAREIETLQSRKRQFVRAFRTLLDRYLSDLELEETRLETEQEISASTDARPQRGIEPRDARDNHDRSGSEEGWLSSLVAESEPEDKPE